MKKYIICGIFVLAVATLSFAGDCAVFVDGGFSDDGNYYVFGQYGKTDNTFQGWADIYVVDVAKNDYVDGEVFLTKPSKATSDKTGKEVYLALESRSFSEIKKYNAKVAQPNQILYIREADEKGEDDEIIFKDFSSSVSSDQAYYHIRLLANYQGSGKNAKSSFSINLEKQDENGKVLARQTIGSPNIKRAGVVGYKIEKIVCSADGKNLVFIIEKKIQDKNGTNIRYMIEAAKLQNDFFENLSITSTAKDADKGQEFETDNSATGNYGTTLPDGYIDVGDAK